MGGREFRLDGSMGENILDLIHLYLYPNYYHFKKLTRCFSNKRLNYFITLLDSYTYASQIPLAGTTETHLPRIATSSMLVAHRSPSSSSMLLGFVLDVVQRSSSLLKGANLEHEADLIMLLVLIIAYQIEIHLCSY